MLNTLPEHHFMKYLPSTHSNETLNVSQTSLLEGIGGVSSYIRLVHLGWSRILERLKIIFSRCFNIKCRARYISWLSVDIWVRVLNESEDILIAHVAEAVAAAAVAFPLTLDGAFLLAATTMAGRDVENPERHCAFFLTARIADLAGCVRSISRENRACKMSK